MSTLFIDPVHTNNVLQKLWVRCEDENFCDVVLIAGAEELRIPAHRLILSEASDYFNGMFTSLMCESVSKEVLMPTVDGEILQSLVAFCYKGRVEIKVDNVEKLLKTADMLLLENVVTACGNFLAEQLHPTNCLGFGLLAERYRCQSLLMRANDYSLEHFADVYKTEDFLKLNADHLVELLTSEDLCASLEEDVFNSVMVWIQHDPTERAKHTVELLKLVRMPFLKPSFLIDHVAPVCMSTECYHIFTKAMEWHLLPDRRTLNVSTKSRKSDQFLMAITKQNHKKMHIHYYCPQRLKWMKWWKDWEHRYYFSAVIMNNCIYIIGGQINNTVLNTVICLDLISMNSSYVKPMTEHRIGSRAAVLRGLLYVVGGKNNDIKSSVEKFDSKTNTWTKSASMLVGRSNFGMAQLNEKLYVIGGSRSADSHNRPFRSVNRLGESNNRSCECYDPLQNFWKFIAEMNEGRESPAVAVANGQIYAMGGASNDSKTVERYDPGVNRWTTICSLREAISTSLSCTTFRDKVIVCYGDRIEEYNPEKNEWNVSASYQGLPNTYCIFYSNKVLTSQFV